MKKKKTKIFYKDEAILLYMVIHLYECLDLVFKALIYVHKNKQMSPHIYLYIFVELKVINKRIERCGCGARINLIIFPYVLLISIQGWSVPYVFIFILPILFFILTLEVLIIVTPFSSIH